MSHGWSESDKNVVRTALERARKRAEDEALKLLNSQQIQNIDDLWKLELKIRDWRREYGDGRFYFSYESVERLLGEFLSRGWTLESDLASLSEERLENIKKNRKHST